jgi:oligopeptide transport system ATP-binding protein
MSEPAIGAGAILVVDHLHKTYRGRDRGFFDPRRVRAEERRPALADASLTLERGAVLGVVGESGSGKSTLARCVSLLERPDSGSVMLGGLDLTTLSPGQLRRERRRVQIVFQDPYASLNPRISVGSALAEVLRVHRLVAPSEVRVRVGELLSLVGLPTQSADRFPAEFSGGQRQRICIARALAASPDVLIADEPLSSLDVSIQAQILNLCLDVREQLALAMIFISHDLHVVRRIAPTIAVMFGGRIVETLPANVSLDEARHPYTQALLAALPSLQAKLPDPGEEDLGEALPVIGCPFRSRCVHAFSACESVDPPLVELHPGHTIACHYAAPAATIVESFAPEVAQPTGESR